MRHLFLRIFPALALLALIITPAAAQTVSQTAAYEEAIGRKFCDSYCGRPGSSFGATSQPWDKEFAARSNRKPVRDLVTQILAGPPAPDACVYRIIGADNYLAEQLRIAGECMTSGGGFNEGWNAALGEVRVPARK